ncbi:MAG: transposase family protein, partial [Rhodobacteraceae bacterium]|nr:transposase family protein [Paracoccaceae bacterium]
VGPAQAGRKHDKRIYDEARVDKPPGVLVLGDRGYLGTPLEVPLKASKNHPLSAVRSGIVIFVIPFIFAIYPEILLIEAAVIDPAPASAGTVQYLPGYDGRVHWPALALLLLRLVLALFCCPARLPGMTRQS